MLEWTIEYMSNAYGTAFGKIMMVLGAALFAAVLGISGALAYTKSYNHKHWWQAVFWLTLATGCLTVVDDVYMKGKKTPVTAATVYTGTLATFFALGLWATDPDEQLPAALIIVQGAANAIQLGAIFNQNRPMYNAQSTPGRLLIV